jgi:phosphatidylglycerophosphatase C
MAKNLTIAVFDFDDTLITRDSLTDFLRYATSKPLFLMRLFRASPTLVRFAAHRLDRAKAKERLLGLFFAGMSNEAFAKLCNAYAARLDSIASEDGLARVAWHQKRGDRVLIISASVEDWIRPWAERHGIHTVLATRLQRERGKLSGRLEGKNCYGQEKVARLLQEYPDRDTYELYAYGDGKSDAYIFKAADHVFEKRFA